jgi:hypothetical protein
MDETLPTAWPDITQREAAGNKWRDAARRETGAKISPTLPLSC